MTLSSDLMSITQVALPGLSLAGLLGSLPIGVPSVLSSAIDPSDVVDDVASLALNNLSLGNILNDALGGLLGNLNILSTDYSGYLIASLCET